MLFYPVYEAIFIKRLNTYSWLVRLDNNILKVNIWNNARLKYHLFEWNKVLIYKNKLLASFNQLYNFIYSLYYNKLIEEYLINNNIKYYKEIYLWNTRIDFYIDNKFVEVKWCSLIIWNIWFFPDWISKRAYNQLLNFIKYWPSKTELWILSTLKIKYFSPAYFIDKNFNNIFWEYINLWWKIRILTIDLKYNFNKLYVWVV